MAHYSIISSQGQHPTLFTGAPRYVGAYLKPGYLEFPEIGSPTAIDWHVGDYVVYTRTGRTYRLYGTPKAAEQAEANKYGAAFLYENVQFFDDVKQLELCPFTDLVPGDNTVHFSTQGTISFFGKPANVAERIQACLENQYGENSWAVTVVTTSDADLLEILNTEVEFSVDGVNCLEVLDKVYETWNNLGWSYSIVGGKNTITIGAPNDRTAANTTEAYSYGNGLVRVEKSIANADEIGTRLFAYGSMKNMDATYYRGLDIYNAESVDIEHLMIPLANWGTTSSKPDARKAYIQDATAVANLGLIPRTAYFDGTGDLPDIHPTLERMTIGEVYDAGGAGYVPNLSKWSRSQRIDEIVAVTNPSDQGAASDMGKVLNESISSNLNAVSVSKNEGQIDQKIWEGTTTKSGRMVMKLGQNALTFTTMSGWTTPIFSNFQLEIIGTNWYKYVPLTVTQTSTNVWSVTLPATVTIQETSAGTVSLYVFGYVLRTVPGDEYSGTRTYTFAASSSTSVEIGIEYTLDKTFSVRIPQIGFDIEQYAALGNGKTISMKTGMCAGRDFEIKEAAYQSGTDSWLLTLYRSNDEDLNILFPNTDYPIAVGDQYVLLDIAMPEMYVTVASNRLLEAAQKLLADICTEQPFYSPQIDAKVVYNESRVLLEGLWMNISFNGVQQYALIDSITIDENGSNIPTYEVALRERKGIDWTENIGSSSSSRSSVSVSGNESQSTNGTVSSVGLEAPTGLVVSGSPITSSGVLQLKLASGYKIPLESELSGYFEINSGRATEVDLKTDYSYFGTRDGLLFDVTAEASVASSPAHLMLRNLGTAANPNYALYTPYALITGGDQIVIDGTPGGGGGSAGNLKELNDVYHNSTNVRRYVSGTVQTDDLLAYDSSKGWYALQLGSNLYITNGVLNASGGGGGSVTSVGLSMPTGFSVSDSPVTSSGTITVSFATGYSLPTTANQTAWSNKYDKPSSGIPKTDLATGVQTSLGLADSALQSHQTIYDLVVKNSAGTTQLTYKPATSGTYELTLTASMVGLGDVENTKLSTWAGSSNITTVGTISTGTWQGTKIGTAYGGTGLTTFTGAYRLLYSTSNSVLTTLAPNTTATRKFLRMTGSGSAGAAPAWDTITQQDVLGTADIGSVSLPVYYKGVSTYELSPITDLDLLGQAADHGYVKAKRFYLYSSGGTDVYFEWVPNSGNGYVKLNAPFLTEGDQIVNSGTPGGGGSGGSTPNLWELIDVSGSIDGKPSAQKILVFNPSATDKNGDTGAWEYANMPTGSITSVALAEGASNGTIHLVVNGVAASDVAVHGLGSFAYKSSLSASDIPDISATYQTKYSFRITGEENATYYLPNFLTGINSSMVTTALGYTPVDPDDVKTLTLKLGSTTIGSAYNPLGSDDATLTITQQNIYDIIGSDKYHPYGGANNVALTASSLTSASTISANSSLTIGAAHTTSASTDDAHRRITFGSMGYYLELKNYGDANTPNYAFHFSAPVVSDGDQVVTDGTSVSPGGGGSGGSGVPHVLIEKSAWEELTTPDPGTIYLIYEE